MKENTKIKKYFLRRLKLKEVRERETRSEKKRIKMP